MLRALILTALIGTVTVPTYTTALTFNGASTNFPASFPFTAKNQIVVQVTLTATTATTTLTQGTHYTVTLPIGAVSGSVTFVCASGVLSGTAISCPITNAYTGTITRSTPVTQTTAFTTQGTYSAKNHENALDKLTMIAQETRASAGVSAAAAVAAHVSAADDHTQYAMLAGRAGGQTLNGGTASGNNLVLRTTSNATKGKILMGSSGTELVLDDTNDSVGIGTASPGTGYKLNVNGAIYAGGASGDTPRFGLMTPYALIAATVYGSVLTGQNLTLSSTYHGTKGSILLGASSAFDEVNTRLGIGDATPDYALDVVGSAAIGTSGTEFFVDDTTNRVGIGTASPTEELDVVGDIDSSGTIAAVTKVQTPVVLGSADMGGDLTLKSTTDSAHGSIFFGHLQTSAYDESNDRLGIGDATPDVALDVVGGALIGTTLQLDIDSEYIGSPNDGVASKFSVLSTNAAGTTAGATGIGAYGPSHSTLSGVLDLYGATVNMKTDPADATPFAIITETSVTLAGAVSVRHGFHEGMLTSPTFSDCGDNIVINNSAPVIITLPDLESGIAYSGCEYVFIVDGGGQDIWISPKAGGVGVGNIIRGICDGTPLSTALGEDVRMPGASDDPGDILRIISGPGGEWNITVCTGAWIPEP